MGVLRGFLASPSAPGSAASLPLLMDTLTRVHWAVPAPIKRLGRHGSLITEQTGMASSSSMWPTCLCHPHSLLRMRAQQQKPERPRPATHSLPAQRLAAAYTNPAETRGTRRTQTEPTRKWPELECPPSTHTQLTGSGPNPCWLQEVQHNPCPSTGRQQPIYKQGDA